MLGLCVAELLFQTFTDANEGELSVRLNQLVSAESCAKVADELSLHEFIRTGSDVKKITGKHMMNVRADVVESLIAAIYLDGGLDAARRFVLEHWTLGLQAQTAPGGTPRRNCRNGRMPSSVSRRNTGRMTVPAPITIRASP